MNWRRTLAILVSIAFCPAVFLALWAAVLYTPLDQRGAIVGFPLMMVGYFLLAGGLFRRRLGLNRGLLCLYMLLIGYPLSWAALLLCFPVLLQNLFILILLLLVSAVMIPLWLAAWLGIWIVGLRRSPETRERTRQFGKTLLGGLGCMAVFLPVLLIALSLKNWMAIKPPEAYEDQGVYPFTAVEYELIWERRTRHSGLHRHISSYSVPIFRVTYETEDGLWQWQDDKGTQDIGKRAVQERETVERRVLALVEEEGYITIDAAKTVQGYVDGQKKSCALLAGGSLAVLGAEGAVWLLWRRRTNAAP